MHFTPEEKEALLEVKGVGPVVIKRFEEIGIYSFAALSKYHADDIADMVASMLQTSCWKNSPQVPNWMLKEWISKEQKSSARKLDCR